MTKTKAESAPQSVSDIQKELDALVKAAQGELNAAEDSASVNEVRVAYLGKKGKINLIRRNLKNLSAEDRPKVGALVNEAGDGLTAEIDTRLESMGSAAIQQKIQSEALDVTMPGVYRRQGKPHPLTQTTREICQVFHSMGFEVIDDNVCPEVETEYYNFEALNFPADHPARDMQDTFYTDVAPQVLLRSQTSNAQIRYMETHELPVRVVSPGRVYRNEEVSSRKNVLFHQLEGLLVDTDVTLSDLKGVLQSFADLFFGQSRPTRFRTSYFPFTEPSAEMDVQCIFCEGAGCRTCGQLGWLEILGCGMVDPNVLKEVGIDPEKHVGFAFGMGIERLAMLKYAIDNIRLFYTNDLRFLQKFQG
ncbi:MAG: phenylalanine--tRNA ligase subunit alpha [Vampirovibrio sp.]|nr:phenylalanine--tRNA ligase subunit alpha [Vampirovibrio sp.]